ncbi:hypothetical protein PPYR_09795 [Photinus pyralis]|uniref:Uncharacterized protein n=3 Tax=Photinus pyralis TaxID=7054 RepID=A0A1Y1MBK9_PHOPY|nr:farnesyl pyrophosphate synthase-like [Photinus pyralis]KAB0795734.1 hypothetical protein PPYR_09795 [Photinus pyralis]
MLCLRNAKRRFALSKCFTTLQRRVNGDEKKDNFVSVFPEVLDILTNSSVYSNVPKFSNHFAEVMEFNVLKEKRFRPSIIMDTYTTLEASENLTEENLHLAKILAWCVELLHTSIIINDDLMDSSQTRANEITWYRKKGVGLNAVNDATLVLEGAFVLLKKYFSNCKAYLPLSDLFRYINMMAAVGQALDWKSNINGNAVFAPFTMDKYKTTIGYKGSIPFVEGPFRAALILSDNGSESTLREVRDVVMKLGEAFQIDNDVLDIFENGKVRKQIGNDISEGKCTWLAVQVLQNGNEEQRRIFKNNYGRIGDEFEEKIVAVYKEMNLFEKYLAYRDETLAYIHERTRKMTPSLRNASISLVENIFPL